MATSESQAGLLILGEGKVISADDFHLAATCTDSHAHQLRETDTEQDTNMQDHTQVKTDNDTRGKRRTAMMPS